MPPTEDELRAALQGGNPSGEIDLDAVLRRSRRRRRPRVLLAGAAGVLAVAAIVVPVSVSAINGQGFGVSSTASGADTAAEPEAATGESGDSGDSAYSDQALQRAPADKLNLCTGALSGVAPAESGLVLTVAAVEAAATETAIPVVVSLTNTGNERITGTTAANPAITLSREGITLWHSNGPQIMMAVVVDLAPGASMQYETTFEPVVCGIADDEGESFRTDLPAAGPGDYGLSAALDLLSDNGVSELITGPVTPITLR